MTDAPTSAELLADVGRVLYGDNWQSPLAEALGVSLRFMQRVAQAVREGNDYRINAGVLDEAAALVRERNAEGVAVLERIAAHLARQSVA